MIIEDYDIARDGFDLSDLAFEAGRPIHLCALNIETNGGNIRCNRLVKNIACISESSVKLDMSSEFKYKSIFSNMTVRACVDGEVDIYLAKASMENLRPYLPQGIGEGLTKDLVGIISDAFVVNRSNKNGHIIGTDVALAMVPGFISKFINLEHSRKNILGYITGYGFSEFGTSKPLTLEQVQVMTEPFNVFLQGIVWKIPNPEFIKELINSNDPSSRYYASIGSSWEIGFNTFSIAESNGSTNLNECTIIDNEEDILALKDDLQVFGGSGISHITGKPIYLNLQGSPLPLGVGLTNNPAADVKGVLVTESPTVPVVIKEDNATDQNKSVPIEIPTVKSTMQINKIEDITDEAIKEVSASVVRDFISKEIADKSKDWKLKVDDKEVALKAAQDELATLKSEFEASKTENTKVKADLEEVRENVRKAELGANYQRRMSLIDEEFALTDADRTSVAEDLQAIASEEDFTKWYGKFSTYAAAKKKVVADEDDAAAKAKKAKEDKEKEEADAKEKADAKAALEAKAKAEGKTVEEIVASAKVEAAVIPNAADLNQPTLMQKISAAFNKDSVKIK